MTVWTCKGYCSRDYQVEYFYKLLHAVRVFVLHQRAELVLTRYFSFRDFHTNRRLYYTMQGFLSSGIFLSGASCDRCDRAWDLWWLLPDKDKSKLISRFFFFKIKFTSIYLPTQDFMHTKRVIAFSTGRSRLSLVLEPEPSSAVSARFER